MPMPVTLATDVNLSLTLQTHSLSDLSCSEEVWQGLEVQASSVSGADGINRRA